MSIEQPEFDIEIDADLDRKADELLEVFVEYNDVVNSLLESTNDAVLSKDIHYKARLYNMLFRKTVPWGLPLSTVDNYKARLYGLAFQKINLGSLSIEGTNELDDAALLVDWVRNCNSLIYLDLKSIQNEGVLCAFLQAAKANPGIDHINIKESHLTRKVIQTILEEMRIEKEFHVDPCNSETDWYVAIRIKHINDELPTDLVTLLTNTIRYDNQDNGSKINIEDSLLTPSVIQTILDKKRYDNQDNGSLIKKEFHVDRNRDVLYEYEPEDDDETSSGAVIPTRAESPIVETDSVDMDYDDRNDRNDNSGGIVSNLVTGVSSGMTAVNEVGSDYLENKYDEANAVHLPAEEVSFIPLLILHQEKVFHVDTCLEFRFKRNRNNDKLPTDLTKPIQNCTNLKKFRCDSISNDRNDLLLLDAVVANTKIEEIEIEMSPISEVIIPMILNESKSLKVLKVGQLEKDYPDKPYAFEWHSDGNRGSFFYKYPAISLHQINKNTAKFYENFSPKIIVRHLVIVGQDKELDDALHLMHFIRNSSSLESINLRNMSNERVVRELLKAAAQNVNITEIHADDVPPVKDLIPTLLETSKSLKRLEINGPTNYYCHSIGDGEVSKQSVHISSFNNDTDRICGKLLQRITVSDLEIVGDDEALDDAPQLMHFIRNSESLKSITLRNMSNERVARELLKAAAQNVKITKIFISPHDEMPPIQDIIPTLLETSKSLTHLSVCGFSLDCSELGKETVSIQYVDNQTIPFYVQVFAKRRLTELQIEYDDGLDDGSLLIDWIKHSGSLKKFRCGSIRNEVVCRELLEAALSNPNVEHLYLEGKCMRFLSIVLNQSKALRCLELDEGEDSDQGEWDDEDSRMIQVNEFPLFEKESLSRLFKRENAHAQSRAMIEKVVLHCDCDRDRNFENVLSCLKENSTFGTFFNTVELKLKNVWYKNCDILVSSLPTMRGVRELEIPKYYDNWFDAKNDFFSAMRKNFCLRRLTLIDKSYDGQGKLLKVQNDINMLCKRNETIQKWADVGYSMPKQNLYRTLLICQMYEFSQDIIYDLLKKYWCRRADHVIEAHKWTNYSSSDKIQRKRKRKET